MVHHKSYPALKLIKIRLKFLNEAYRAVENVIHYKQLNKRIIKHELNGVVSGEAWVVCSNLINYSIIYFIRILTDCL